MRAAMDRDAVSRHLTALWERILGKKVRPTDDFFEMGGDSMAALKMVLEVQSTYHVELDVETFFEDPRIVRLTDVLMKKGLAEA